ncbi:MAG: hypothetical protein KDD70_16260 [Bdellovibrionales bacterium]|nr:hypothetical protein [Bdellovibrionales bacterium]
MKRSEIDESLRGADIHSFGGCSRLLRQYQIVGKELERVAESMDCYRSAPCPEAMRNFRQSLVFIPTEVLRSYRDDLLDPSISSERLFISSLHNRWRLPVLAIIGVIGAVGLGLGAASSGASFFLSFAITLSIATPFAVVWHLAPRDGVLRRLRFAKWLADEIARRNGDGTSVRRRRTTSILSPLWSREALWAAEAHGSSRGLLH